ncbi:MAG: hypothetical protein ACI9TK_001160, partial [Flavobacteriaceae bacterium]
VYGLRCLRTHEKGLSRLAILREVNIEKAPLFFCYKILES